MKKLCSIILIMVITVNLSQGVTISAAKKYDPSKMTIAEYVIAHIDNFEREIELIYYFKKHQYDFEMLHNDLKSVFYNNPQLIQFNINQNDYYEFSYQQEYDYTTDNWIYTSFNMIIKKYQLTKSEYKKKKAEMDKAAEKALQYAANCSTDLEKALAIHDYIALNTEYYHEAANTTDYNKVYNSKYLYAFNAYGVLVDKSAVCNGYAEAYIYILKKLGINCTHVNSYGMNHSWNYVEIDDKWYHVDITWDDPSFDGNDLLGNVRHEYFLLSDGEIRNREHYDWEILGDYPRASNKKYNNYFWREVENPIVKLGDYWYYTEINEDNLGLNNNYSQDFYGETSYVYTDIIKHNISTGKKSTIHTFASTWYDYNSGWYYYGTYSGLSLYNGKFYYNTADGIYSIEPSGNNPVLVHKPADLHGYIYGMIMDGNKIIYTVKSNPSDKDSLKTKAIRPADSTKVTLNAKSGSSKVGQTKSLKVTIAPSNSKDYIYWVSSDPKIATVNNGRVTGVKKGKCVITAYTDSGAKAEFKVTIK